MHINLNQTDMPFIPELVSAYGVKMPAILYGTAWKKNATSPLVEQAIKLGFRGVDTACQPKHYHEAGVGLGVARCIQENIVSREQLYLQTKFTPLNGHDPLQIPYDADAPLAEQVQQSFQASLNNLQTTYLDGWVLHSPLSDRRQLMEVWRAMERIQATQACRQLGVSNCYDLETLKFLYQNAEIKPAIVQNRFHAQTAYDQDIRAFCLRSHIIYQSFWTLTANPAILDHALVHALATRYQKTAAQLFFRFVTQLGIQPLTGTASATHMQEDLAIFDFELTDSECQSLSQVLIDNAA